MARPLRIELAGGLYHVTSRGDRRENIYVTDQDRLLWLQLFSDTCERFNWVCHAWCLMDNHYHIVIETMEANLARGMRHLNGVFTQTTNHLHQRVGHLFQGRYKAILVEKNSHLLELARYVVLNPVRAGMVRDVADWPWSSWQATTNCEPSPKWLDTDGILAQFSHTRTNAAAAYAEFVREGVGLPSVWKKLNNQIFLGSELFVKHMQSVAGKQEMKEIPRSQRCRKVFTLDEYEQNSESVKIAMVRAFSSGGYTMEEIANHFKVHYSTVSRTLKRNGSI